MKINVEIDLDWIDEEKGLDLSIQEQIIDGVTAQVKAKINKDIEDKVNKIIDEQIVATINKKTEDLFSDFINRPVTISDNYGSKIKVYDTMEQLIKERFDNFMEQPVDAKGQIYTGSSYGSKYKRVEFIIDNQLKEFADKFTKDAVKTVSEEIKQHVKEGLTNKLGAELMNVLKVNEMLQLPDKK